MQTERRRGRSLRHSSSFPGTRVTHQGQHRAAASRSSGPLLAAGWRKPGDVRHVSTPPTTAGSERVSARGRPASRRRAAVAATTTLPASLSHARRGATLRPARASPTARTTLRIVAEDALGQRGAVAAPAQHRRHAADAVLERARGTHDRPRVSDTASGVAGATLEVRRNSNEPYRTLNVDAQRAASCARSSTAAARRRSTCASPRATTRATSPRATRRGSSVDEREGRPALPQGPLGPREDPVRPPRDAARPPHALRRPVARRPDDRRDVGRSASAAPSRKAAGTAVTDRRGRFSLKVPAGPEPHLPPRLRRLRRRARRRPRRLRPRAGLEHDPRLAHPLSAAAASASPAACATAASASRAAASCSSSRASTSGKWRTFEDMRTNRKGRWRVSYGFSGRAGQLPDPRAHPQAVGLPVRARLLARR